MRGAEASLQALMSSVNPPGYKFDHLSSNPLTLPPASGHEPQAAQTPDMSSSHFQQHASSNSSMVGYDPQQTQGLELRGMASGITPSQAGSVDEMTSLSTVLSQAMTPFSYSQAGNVDEMTSLSAGFGQTTTSYSYPQTVNMEELTSVASGPLPGITSFSHPHPASMNTTTSPSAGTLPGISSFSSLESGNFYTQSQPPQSLYASTQNTGNTPVVNRPRRNVPNVISSPYSTPCRDPTTDEREKARLRQLKAERRKERNKEAARQSNLKKKLERDRLEKQSVELWEENLQLHQDIRNLSQKLRHFRHMRSVMQHVCHHAPSPMTACH